MSRKDNKQPNEGTGTKDSEQLLPVTRRSILAASATAGILGLGANAVSAASVADKTCSNYGTLTVGDGDFDAINNMWSTTDVTQCTYEYDDGSYGWDWDRNGTGCNDPNFPQTLCGTKPWGRDTGASQFPIRRKNVDTLEMALDVGMSISGTEWNLTEEWWLTSNKPGGGNDVSNSITHEVMTVIEWGSDHGHGTPVDSNIGTDAYGNTFDYWQHYDIGWNFHIFRISGNSAPSNVDFTPVMNYMSNNFGAGGDLWVSGMEIGNEYWDYTDGKTTFYEFDVTVNGTTSVSGSNTSSSDSTAPTAPSNLSSPGSTDTSVDLSWDAASDSGTGVESYTIYVDGSQDHTVLAGTTTTTVKNLSTGTSYDFSVTADDGAGNESSASNTITITPGSTTSSSSGIPIPGTIEVEDFDSGGQNSSYYDTTAGEEDGTNEYRSTDVDIAGDDQGDYSVGWLSQGEWLEYTVSVDADGYYDLTARVASSGGGGPFHVEMDGTDVTGNISVPDTGGWSTYTTVTVSDVYLKAGTQVMRVAMDSGSFNIDHLDWASASSASSSSNLLTDPGFENGGTDWSSLATFTTTTSPVNGGSHAGLAYNRSNSWEGIRQDVTSQLSNNGTGTYTISGSARIGYGSGKARITVMIDDDNGTSYYTGSFVSVDDYSWSQISDSLDLSWSGLNKAKLYIETSSTLEALYLDDASLTK